MELLRISVSLHYKNGYSVSSSLWNAEKKKLVYVIKCDDEEITRYLRIEDIGTHLVRISRDLDTIEVRVFVEKTENDLDEAIKISKLKILNEVTRLNDTFEQLKIKSKC